MKGVNKYQQDLKAYTAFVSIVIIFSNQRYKPFQKNFYLSGWNLLLKAKNGNIKSTYDKKVATKMKIRFTAEIIDDNGNVLKNPVSVETKVPDLTDFNCPSEFLKVFDQYERPVIEARNQIASEITKDYLEEAAFLKDRKSKP